MPTDCESTACNVSKGFAITMPLDAAISIKWSIPAISSQAMDFLSFWRIIGWFD